MDLLCTGTVGFLGSHVLLEWLNSHPDGRALCLARGTRDAAPRDRVLAALATAAADCGTAFDADALGSRITVLSADLRALRLRDDPGWQAWVRATDGFELLHGAANLSFREEDRGEVWSSNVDGTRRLLDELVGTPGLRVLNYISTAYVSGTREGVIGEEDTLLPEAFTNAYEESKWHAERVVREHAADHGTGIRIFRPSIIIGHSRTLRTSSRTGIYKVIELLRRAAGHIPAQTPPVRLPAKRQASINLIPVDVVVDEMLAILGQGSATTGRAYHLTNERPLSLADLLYGLPPLVGVALEAEFPRGSNGAGGAGGSGGLDGTGGSDGARLPGRRDNLVEAVLLRKMRHYLPYLCYERTFDRTNVRACGADRAQAGHWLDLVRMREFVQAFLDELDAEAHATAASRAGIGTRVGADTRAATEAQASTAGWPAAAGASPAPVPTPGAELVGSSAGTEPAR